MIEKLRTKLAGDIHLKEILTGSAITFILKMSGMLLGYVVMLIISRKYGAEGIGVYNLMLSIMIFVAMISAMGMNISILRYVGQFNKNEDEHKLKLLYRYVIELTLPLSIFLAFILYLSTGFVAENILHNQTYKPAIEFAAFVVPFMLLLNVSVEFIRGLKQLKVSEFLRSVSRPSINIVLLVILSLFISSQLLPLYTLGIGIIISALYAVYFIMKRLQKIDSKPSYNFTKKELLSTSFPMMITAVASFIMGNISLFILEMYSTTENVGIFSVSFKIATLVNLVLVVINTISAPKFSELYWKKQYTELQHAITHSSNVIFFVSFLISIIIITFSKFILSVFGEEFIIGKSVLIILIISQMINSTTGSVGVFLNMSGNHNVLRNIIIIAMLISFALNILLIPSYGINGAAIATIVGVFFLNVTAVVYTKSKLGFITYFTIKRV